MAAQSVTLDVSTADPVAALRRVAGGSSWARRLLVIGALAAVVTLVAVAAPRVGKTFGDALVRALHADPRFVVMGVLFELLSFAGYVFLFWHVAGARSSSSARIGLRASWEIALASTAATRLLPTAGAGGAALTFWSLRRSGHSSRDATLWLGIVVLPGA